MTDKEFNTFIQERLKIYSDVAQMESVDSTVKTVNKKLLDFYRTIENKLQLLDIIKKYIKINDNYSEQGTGSTQAIEIIVPNCISVEEDDQYTDDCYPNSDFETLLKLLEE